jgi:PAS domain S-box-containing protein
MDDQYKELFQKNPLPVFVVDREKHSFLAVNESASRHYGYSRSEFLTMTYADILLDMDDPKSTDGRARRRKHRKKNEEVMDVETAVEPIYFDNIPAKLILVRDVSKRIQAEKALKESEERFSKAFHASPIPTTVTRLETGFFIDVNQSFLKMTGYGRREVIGRTSLDLKMWAGLEDRNTFIRQLKEEGSIRDLERVLQTKRGELLEVLYSAELIEVGGESCLLIRIQDITESKRNLKKIRDYQNELRLLASELTLAEERERRRIAVDLHDYIGQNLAMIKIQLGSLQKELDSRHVTRLKTIRDLLEETIRSTRSLSFELSPPVLYEFGLESAVEWLVEKTQEQYGIQIQFQNDQEPKPLTDTLKIQLFAIIRELLVNLVKHSRAQKAKVSIRKSSNSLVITVDDDGVGFDPKSLEQPFQHTAGFGLFSIRERIANLGGRLEVRSKPGAGTKITLVAPLITKEVNT